MRTVVTIVKNKENIFTKTSASWKNATKVDRMIISWPISADT